MKKTRRHKTHKKHNKTQKNSHKIRRLPNLTPPYINDVSILIFQEAPKNMPPLADSVAIQNEQGSYSPTVNKELVMLQSISRKNVLDCNNEKAFKLQEPLEIGIPGKIFGKDCVPYYDPKAVRFLLRNLSANKHVKIDKIVPPIQSQSNCWFNTMFVTLFVSDKGRKFFHFFRQLMIQGVQADGKVIPKNLRNGFALLNFAIDACLTGNKYAYILDTNAIIRDIYENIPESYKKKLPYITNIDEAGNPLRYYGSLIYYLNNTSIQDLIFQNTNEKWKENVIAEVDKHNHLPHIIILEIFDGPNQTRGESGKTTNKPRSFFIKGAKYMLDSAIIRDTTQQHFCATLTCEGKQMAYDGLSFHRLNYLEWKQYINSDFYWTFDGTNYPDGKSLKWNFTHGYQMLIYYRVK